MVRRARDLDGTVWAADGSRSRLVRKVTWQCLWTRPRVVIFSHVHLGRLAPIVRMLCARSRVITLAYGIDVWKPLDRLGRIGLRFSTAFWSISRYTARQLAHHNRVPMSRVYLLPLAIDDLPPLQSVDANGHISLLSVCRLDRNERYKGIDLALQAHALLVQEFRGLRFRIVGDGTDIDRLRVLVADLGTSDLVDFLGGVPSSELAGEYARCNVFVLPSRKEGFGIVFLEAMAYAKPIVACAAGGAPEVVPDGECGLLVPANDLLALTESLRRLLADSQLRARLGARGRQRVERFYTRSRFEDRVAQLVDGRVAALGSEAS